MSMNIEFSDLYEQCGNCAGTGTVIETTTYGTPFRKQCPKCHGLGSIKKPSYRHRGPREWDEGDEAEERGMTGIACELKELVIKYLQLRTLQIRLKLRSES